MEKKLWLYYSVLLKLFFWEPSALWMVTMNSTYIHCHTYMFLLQIRKNMVELYFVKRGHPVDFFDVDKDLVPTTDIRNRDLLEYLQKRIPSMNITIETSQVCYVCSLITSIIISLINLSIKACGVNWNFGMCIASSPIFLVHTQINKKSITVIISK